MNLKEMKMLVKMKTAMGESVDQSILDQIAVEEARIAAEQEKEAALVEERKSAFGSIFNDLAKDISKLMEEDKKRTAEQQDAVDRFAALMNSIATKQFVPPTIEEKVETVLEVEEIIEDVQEIIEQPPVVEEKVQEKPKKKKTLVEAAVQKVNETSAPSMFVQPEPSVTDKDLKAIQQKLKLLEGWVSKISMAGPGGGAVWLKDLDDIARSSIVNANGGDVLKYNATTKKWEAGAVSANGVVGTLHQVTAAGNTTTNSITVGSAKADYLAINTSATHTVATGEIAWNPSDLTLDVGLASGVTLQIGQEQFIRVKAANTITNGQTVMFAGAAGEHVLALPCNMAVPGFRPEWFIGVATHDIAKNAFGYITTFGKVHDVDTLAWSEGDILYADPNVIGGLTNIEPDNINILVAAVTKRAGGDGHLLVRPSWRFFLDELNGVTISSPSNGQVLMYISSSNTWVNHSIEGFQTTAGLAANVATLTSNNTLHLGGIAANQYAYANAVYSQILWVNPSPSPTTIFRTSVEATDHGAQIDISTGVPGFGSLYTWVLDEVGISFPNGAGIQTVPFVGDADLLGGVAADQYAYANSLASYQTTAGLSANVAKLTANNTSFVGSVSAANVVSNAQLSANLANYQTAAGLSANVAKLTSNNTLYLGGIAADQYAFANALTSYQTTAGLAANVATLTSNNTSFVGSVSAANVVSNAQLSSNLANYQTTTGLSANVAVLTSNNANFLGTKAANQYAYANGSNFSINNPLTVTYAGATPTGYALTLAAANTQGGTGYADFLKVTNNSAGATAINKSFRLTSGGGIEIVNSGYTATILGLSDTGDFSVSGKIQVNGKTAVNGPAFSAYAAAILQTIPTDVQTKVLFQTEEYDTNSCYTNSRFTPNVEGYYQINAEVRLDGTSGTGEMMIILYKNGSEYKRGTNQSGTQIAANFWAMQVSSLVYANGSTDYFEIYVQQGSGGNRTVTAVNNSAITWFNGCMLRGA